MLAVVHAATRAGGRIDTHAEAMIRRAKALLHEHLEQPVALERAAHELRVSAAWLRRNFRHHTGFDVEPIPPPTADQPRDASIEWIRP